MTKTHIATISLLVVFGLSLLVWDAIVIFNEVKGDTISAITWEAAQRYWVIPFFFGALMSHFFFPRRERIIPVYGSTVMLVTIPALAALNAFLAWLYGAQHWASPVAFGAGLVFGWLLWPNKGKDGA